MPTHGSSDGAADSPDRLLVLNPAAGNADHADLVRDAAAVAGFAVRETDGAGDAIAIAREAGTDADVVAACGGDGTLNEVVTGLVAADALDDVTVGVVPAGTGNNFAGNVGVRDVEHAFEVLDGGERRRIDLGVVEGPVRSDRADGLDGLPFLNSCVAGLTADASAETTSDLKDRLGVLAYVLTTLQRATDFDGLSLEVETTGRDGTTWRGDAACVLVGNARRFPAEGRTQADVEDGRFDVTIVEEQPALDMASEAALARLLGADTSGITRLEAPGLSVTVRDGDTTFSLDGEMLTAGDLRLRTVEGALELCVGEAYDPHPDY